LRQGGLGIDRVEGLEASGSVDGEDIPFGAVANRVGGRGTDGTRDAQSCSEQTCDEQADGTCASAIDPGHARFSSCAPDRQQLRSMISTSRLFGMLKMRAFR